MMAAADAAAFATLEGGVFRAVGLGGGVFLVGVFFVVAFVFFCFAVEEEGGRLAFLCLVKPIRLPPFQEQHCGHLAFLMSTTVEHFWQSHVNFSLVSATLPPAGCVMVVGWLVVGVFGVLSTGGVRDATVGKHL